VPYLTLFASAAIIYFWLNPRLEELGNELNALRRERSILIKAVEDCQREHTQAKGVLSNSCEAQSILLDLGISFIHHLFLFILSCAHISMCRLHDLRKTD